MEKLVIIGAGSHGSGIETIVNAINQENLTWDLLGYLDDDGSKAGVIGGIDQSIDDAYYVIGVNEPNLKKSLYHKKGMNTPATIIHPSASIGSNTTIGEGVVIFAGAIVTGNVQIGQHSHINVGSTVSQGSSIGQFCSIAPGVNIAGQVTVGEETLIGTGCSIIHLINIAKNTTIGAGSVIIRDVTEEKCTVVGIPGKVIKHNE